MIIAVQIHNGSLGRVVECETVEKGQSLLREWAEAQFQRELTAEELSDIENDLEIYNDDDADNHYTFSIGMTE